MTALIRAAAALLTLAFAGPALAQTDTPDSRRTAAQALVKSMDALAGPDRVLATMRAGMQAPIMHSIRSQPNLTEAQQKRAAEVTQIRQVR